jgi:hypothetical protein
MFYHLLVPKQITASFSLASQSLNESSGSWYPWANTLSLWTKRRQIVMVGSPTALTNFPVMIKLDSTRITYASVQAAGQDLRFTDSSGNVLAHEIESWNPAGTSIIWVKIPTYAAAPATTTIFLYYGNGAAADGQNRTAVWSGGHVGVWHLNAALTDATSNGNNGTTFGPTSTTGNVSGGYSFAGGTDYMSMGAAAATNIVDEVTVELWAKPTTATGDVKILSREDNVTGGYKLGLQGSKVEFEIRTSANAPFLNRSVSGGTTLSNGVWYHFVGVYSKSSGYIATYVNGVLDRNYATAAILGTSTANLTIGREVWLAGYNFPGIIDEIRISNTSRSADWILTNYRSMTDQLGTFSAEETPPAVNPITIQLSQAATATVTVPYTVTGTATVGLDHSLTSGSLVINIGQSSGDLFIPITRDNLIEGDETVIVTLGTPTNAALGSITVHTVTIVDEALFLPDAVDDTLTLTDLNPKIISVLANDTDANNDPLTITAVTQGTAGTVAITGTTVTYTPSDDFSAVDSFTYTISDGRGGSDTATVTLNYDIPFTWLGAGGDANWTTPANWSGGVVPGAANTAFFNDQCTTYCNPVQVGNISVGGFKVNSSYTGTISQTAGLLWTIGAAGWKHRGGTFIGNNANLTSSGGFLLSGGAFTSTSATFTVGSGDFYITSATPTFNHNSGSIVLTCGYALTCKVFAPTQPFNNLHFSGNYSSFDLDGGSISVEGNLLEGDRYSSTYWGQPLNNGTINVYGNISVVNYGYRGSALIVVAGNASGQTITGNGYYMPALTISAGANNVTFVGDVGVASHYTMTSVGTLTVAGSTLRLYCGYAVSCNITPGAYNYNDVVMGGSYTTFNLGGATFNVGGNFSSGDTYSSSYPNQPINSGTILVSGDINFINNGKRGTATITAVGATDQTIGGTKNSPGTILTINKSTLATKMTATSPLAFSSAGQNLAISTGTLDMAGYDLAVNLNLSIAATGRLICGGGTVTAASYTILGEVSCGTSVGITWTGLAGDNLWSTAGNWSNNTIPGASDTAIFNGICTGLNCNVTMNSSISVKGINILSSYAGTITQPSGNAITVGTSGWTQAAGTFAGGNSAITMNGHFVLSGGTYTATSGTMTFNGSLNFTASGSPTFNHNSGTILFTSISSATSIFTPGTLDFNDVTFGGYNLTTNLTGTLKVNGTLTLADTYSNSGWINTGTVSAKGNVVTTNNGKYGSGIIQISGSSNQLVTGSATGYFPNLVIASTGGTVTLTGTIPFFGGNYTYTSGTVDATTSTLLFTSNTSASNTVTPGAVNYNNVTFTGFNLTTTLVGTLTATGTVTFSDGYSSSGYVNGGTISMKGNFVSSNKGKLGTTLMKATGSGNQTLSGVVGAHIPNLEIASTGGTVTESGTLYVRGNYTHTSGAVDTTGSTLYFYNYATTATVTPGTVAYNNVTFTGSQATFTISGTMTVNGTLAYSDTYTSGYYLNGGTILAYGDIAASGYGRAGTTLIKVVGSGNQTITGTASSIMPTLEIASTGGTVTFSGTLWIKGNYTYTSGTVDAGTSTVKFYNYASASTLTPGSVNYNNVTIYGYQATHNISGSLYVNGLFSAGDTYTSGYSINTGTVEAMGDVSFASYGYGGSAVLNFVGTTSGTLSQNVGSKPMGTSLVVNKTGGAKVTMATLTTLNAASQDLTVNGGTFDLGGFDLSVVDVLTVGASGTVKCSGGILTSASVVNSGIINCPGYASYEFNWTGSTADGKWSTAGNWLGGVVPGVNDVAYFVNSSCGANCNMTFDVDPAARGILTEVGFTGVLTQASGVPLNIGISGWNHKGGTFTGSNSNILIQGGLSVSAGTVTLSSATTTVGYPFCGTKTVLNITGTGTVAHNNGRFKVAQRRPTATSCVATGNMNFANGFTLYDFETQAEGGVSWAEVLTPTSGTTLNVLNNFYDYGQTVNFNIDLTGSLFVNKAVPNSTTNYVRMVGTGLQEYTFQPGSFVTNTLKIDKPSGAVQAASGTTDLSLFSLELLQGSFTAPSGVLTLGTDVLATTSMNSILVSAGTTFNHNNGTTKFALSRASSCSCNTTGTLNVTGGTTFNNVEIAAQPNSGGWTNTNSSGGSTISVLGNFVQNGTILNSNWAIGGNLTIGIDSAGGTGAITLNGTGAQTITTEAGGAVLSSGTWTINKPSGTATLAGSGLYLMSAGQNFNLTAGTLNLNASVLNVKNTLTVSSGATLTCANGGYTKTTLVNNGTINCSTGYVRQVLADSPKAYWRLGEISSTYKAVDQSGNSNVGTYTTPADITFGVTRVSTALTDTGVSIVNNGYVSLPTPVALASSYSLESWFKYPLPANGTWNTLYRGPNYHHVIVQRSNMHLGSYQGSFIDSGFVMSTLSAGWHHLVVVGTGTTMTYYIDKVNVGSIGTKVSDTIQYFGNYQLGAQSFGAIDDVSIYDVALTPAQISNHYDAALP